MVARIFLARKHHHFGEVCEQKFAENIHTIDLKHIHFERNYIMKCSCNKFHRRRYESCEERKRPHVILSNFRWTMRSFDTRLRAMTYSANVGSSTWAYTSCSYTGHCLDIEETIKCSAVVFEPSFRFSIHILM